MRSKLPVLPGSHLHTSRGWEGEGGRNNPLAPRNKGHGPFITTDFLSHVSRPREEVDRAAGRTR